MAALSPTGSDVDPAKLTVLKDALYDAAQQAGSDQTHFTQEELLDFGVTADAGVLMRLIQQLMNERLFASAARQGGGYLWRWRSPADAAKYRALTREQQMIYEMIDDAGAEGIWTRTLRARLQFHESVLKQHLKALESKVFIKDMKSVEHPHKKMYIKADLRPSDRATGGPWYTDSNLDEAFISELQKVIFDFITRQSTYKSHHGGSHREKVPKKGILKGDKDVKGKKRSADEISAGDETKTKPAVREPKRTVLLPLPAGYNNYPTVRQIAELISSSGITNNTTLSISDCQQLVDVLVYDGLIEPVKVGKRKGYRTARAAKVDPMPLTAIMRGDIDIDQDMMELDAGDMGAGPMDNGLTEAPCGRCPVFALCEEGGPVNPSSCVYFQRWLGD